MATKIAERSTDWCVNYGHNNTPSPYGDYRYYWVLYYEQTADNKKNNTSNLIIDQYIQVHFTESPPDDWMASGYTYYPSSSGNISIDGVWQTAKSNAQGTIQLGDSYRLIYQKTYTKTISHNTDGTRSFQWQGMGFGRYSGTSTYTLPQILRPTVINDVGSFDIDDGISLPVTKYVNTYYDTLEILYGDEVLKTINGFTNDIATGTSVAVKVSFTNDDLNNIYTKIPTGDTAKLTFKMTTYKTSDKSSIIGTSTKTITGNFTIILPSVNGAICTDRIVNMPDYTGDQTKQTIVKNVSLVTVSIPSSMQAIANTRCANIVEYVVDDTHAKYNANGTSVDLGRATKNYVTIYAVDSRGTSSLPYIQEFSNYIDYNPITINTRNYEVIRCDENLNDSGIGEYMKAYVEGEWWKGNFGVVENKLTTVVYYLDTEAGYWGDDLSDFIAQASIGYLDETLIDTSTPGVFKYNGPIYSAEEDKKFDTNTAYDIAIGFLDKFSNLALTITVPYGKPAMAIYKNKASLGGPYNESLGGTQLWDDVYLNGHPLFPIGYIYMSVDPTNPKEFFGGEWERLKDVFLLGASDTYTAGSNGGEAEVVLTKGQLPKHNHTQSATGENYQINDMATSVTTGSKADRLTGTGAGVASYHQSAWISSGGNLVGTDFVGNNEAHNNMPPYLAVYMWKRIA